MPEIAIVGYSNEVFSDVINPSETINSQHRPNIKERSKKLMISQITNGSDHIVNEHSAINAVLIECDHR
jgi:DNA-binding LacI/PurR family transcriptional regulator